MDVSSVTRIGAIVFLLAAKAFFTAAEFALLASKHSAPDDPEEDLLQANPAVDRARRSLQSPISSVRLGITLSTLALGWIAITIFTPAVHQALDGAGIPLPSGVGSALAALVSLLILAAVYLLVGDLVPRAVGLSRAGGLSRLVAGPLNVFTALMKPFLWVLNAAAGPIVVRTGRRVPGGFGQVHGPEEIEALLRYGRAAGVVEEDEEEMIHGVFELTRTVAREVMTPRPDIVAFPETATLDEVLDTVASSGYSRFPVFRESIDDVVGVLLVKDFLRWSRGAPEGEFSLASVMRGPFFVPDTKPVDDLLAEFRDQKLHLAVVVDEFGGTDGLVTLEDLVEEIVGDIFDEHDVLEEDITVIGKGRARIDGGADPTDLIEEFSLGEVEDAEDYDTVAGYVIGKLGRIPEPGEKVRLGPAELEVTETTEQRVTSLEMRIVGPVGTSPEAASEHPSPSGPERGSS
jgi:CBS domain containing-hemolysin-like protein